MNFTKSKAKREMYANLTVYPCSKCSNAWSVFAKIASTLDGIPWITSVLPTLACAEVHGSVVVKLLQRLEHKESPAGSDERAIKHSILRPTRCFQKLMNTKRMTIIAFPYGHPFTTGFDDIPPFIFCTYTHMSPLKSSPLMACRWAWELPFDYHA